MNRWTQWALLATLTLLLAACSSTLQPEALPSSQEPSPKEEPTPRSVEVDDAEIDAITDSWDTYEVEFLGTGMGSQWDAEIDHALLEVDPDRVEQLIARATVRFLSDPDFPDDNDDYKRPERVEFTAYDGNGEPLATVEATGVPPLDPTPDEGQEGIGAALIYQATFDGVIDGSAVASVGVHIVEPDEDPDLSFENRAFEIIVLRHPAGTVSVGGTPSQLVWWQAEEEVGEYAIDLPEEFAGGKVPVTFAVTDVEDDDRVVVLQVLNEEEEVLVEETFTRPGFYPNGNRSSGESFLHFWVDWARHELVDGFDTRNELLLATLDVTVSPATERLFARVISPDPSRGKGNGDSVIFSAVTAEIHPPVTPQPEPEPEPEPEPVPEPDEGGQGCTPGFWRNWTGLGPQPNAWAATGYSPSTDFDEVFEDAFPGMTLLEVVSQGGGGLKALGRHTVAALLNASHPNVSYDLSVQEVINSFDAVFPGDDYEALKNEFERFNEQGCPLNRNNF